MQNNKPARTLAGASKKDKSRIESWDAETQQLLRALYVLVILSMIVGALGGFIVFAILLDKWFP